MYMAILSPIAALSADSWQFWIYRQSTRRIVSIRGYTARRLCLIGSFCKDIARLSSRETGETTRIPSRTSIKQGLSQKRVAQDVYHPELHLTHQSAPDPQDTLQSPRFSIMINFSGHPRQVKLIVIYNSMESAGTLQVNQVPHWSHRTEILLHTGALIVQIKSIISSSSGNPIGLTISKPFCPRRF